jgi:hypothetical protein
MSRQSFAVKATGTLTGILAWPSGSLLSERMVVRITTKVLYSQQRKPSSMLQVSPPPAPPSA